MSDFKGKGSWRRPCSTTPEERNLRDRYFYQKPPMSFDEFEKKFKELAKKGLIKRDGRIIK